MIKLTLILLLSYYFYYSILASDIPMMFINGLLWSMLVGFAILNYIKNSEK